jgi:mevalonate kinase
MNSFFARGKLLLSSEYVVLQGAEALALPLKPGQRLELSRPAEPKHTSAQPRMEWEASDPKGTWFRAIVDPASWEVLETSSRDLSERLVNVLKALADLRPAFLPELQGVKVRTSLDHPRDYGLGSSSTLTSLLAQWAGVDPLDLHFRTSEGSGYDVACATADGPLVYRLEKPRPQFHRVLFDPPFHARLFFAWLGRKQDTAASLASIRNGFHPGESDIKFFSHLTDAMIRASTLEAFQELMEVHETHLSALLHLPPVREKFPGFPGSIKSLGAWGGDFILLATDLKEKELRGYLEKHRITALFPYKDLVYEAAK